MPKSIEYFCFTGYVTLWTDIIWVIAALSILLGNITAVYQNSVKRMLAYSSISHTGYMMLAILTSGSTSAGAVLYYSAAYSVASIGAFAVLNIIEGQGSAGKGQGTYDSFAGLGKRNPLLAFGMTISMLSLAGIPPLAGFFGKYYLFSTALQNDYVWLVLIAALGSLIGVYYYLRVIIKIYTAPVYHLEGEVLLPFKEVGWSIKILLILTIALSLLLGIFPDLIIKLV